MPTTTERNGADRRVRVLIACDHIDYEGALHGGGRQLIELTRGLEGRPVDPVICVLRHATVLGRQLQAEGLPIRFFGHGRFNPLPLFRFISLIRQHRIEVLHLTDFGASTFGRLAGWLCGVPAIVQVITHHSPHQKRGFPRYVEIAFRALAPLTARALAISETVREFAIERMGFPAAKVEVLHYPLPRHSFAVPTTSEVAEVRRRHGIPAGAPIIGAVTRFYPSKGIRYLIEAFARVRREHPDAWLMLVGTGPEEDTLQALSRELEVEDRVVFAGFQRAAHHYAGAFTIAAVPSLEEGFGLVALESLALGVPVVASRVGGLPEIVHHEVNGLLVRPANASSLAIALSHLLSDPELRGRLARAGTATTQHFSLDRYVERLVALYLELARRPLPRPSEAPRTGTTAPARASEPPSERAVAARAVHGD